MSEEEASSGLDPSKVQSGVATASTEILRKIDPNAPYGVITILSGGEGIKIDGRILPVETCTSAWMESYDERRHREIQEYMFDIHKEDVQEKMMDFLEEAMMDFYRKEFKEGFLIASGRSPEERMSGLDRAMLHSLFDKAMKRFLLHLDEGLDPAREDEL